LNYRHCLWRKALKPKKNKNYESNPPPFFKENFSPPLSDLKITQVFGYPRKNAFPHNGLDFSIKFDREVKAINSGKVIFANYLVRSGNTIIIDHGLFIFSSYSHLEKILVKKGDLVKRGELIGIAGSSGEIIKGEHLHLTTRVGGSIVDPLQLLNLKIF